MVINQKLVEKAIEVLEKMPKPTSGLPNALKGDISSFGASIVQAGLLPSVLFFSEGKFLKFTDFTEGSNELKTWTEDWTKTDKRRARLMAIIYWVATANAPESLRPLFDYVRQNPNKLDDITEAALAVKIAMRAFKFDESDSSNKTKTQTT